MNSIKTYLAVWLAGLVVGLALMERWRRTGLGVTAAENVGQAVDTEAAGTPRQASADQPRMSAVVVAGAKADAQRARQLLDRVLPWGSNSAPAFAQLQRAGKATARGNSPHRPA